MNENHIPFFQIKPNGENNKLPINTSNIREDSIRRRQIRSDKCRDIKFPVSKLEQIRFKSACKQADFFYKKIHGYDQKLTQTHFNTLLLKYALRNQHEVGWERPYKDSKVYMHTKPTEKEYELIGGPHGLSTRKAISDRKLIYCLVISVLEYLEHKGEYKSVIL